MFTSLIFIILIPALAVAVGAARLSVLRTRGTTDSNASRTDDYIENVRSEVLYQADFQRLHED